jgi:hypothetical protein
MCFSSHPNTTFKQYGIKDSTVRSNLTLPILIQISSLVINYHLPKVGIHNLSMHLRNSAILGTTKLTAESWTKKSCEFAIADLQKLTSAILQLSAVYCHFCYFLVPFPQLRMVLKINQKIVFELSVSPETKNLP